ncbi:hypothetical protein JR316_0012448 [Psilocybe cubensis]|uniref:Uncharacterized protein n=2 Tax=Psilocybe cubensis TaxID=181762 RepID=A0A8H7XMQ9_PSICU|nr:hypothetical protein JR316_0012448 [Psilocybe cubensis]KAH9475337.1 hypothetical protein JR316_0012448 [Psilocybe cubensis]
MSLPDSSLSQAGPSGTSGQWIEQDNNGIVLTIPVEGPTTPPPSTPSRATRSTKRSPSKSSHSKKRDTESPRTPKTQPLSYYIETAMAAESQVMEESPSPSVVQRKKAKARPIAATASSSSTHIPPSSSVTHVPVGQPATSSVARRAALEAQSQAQYLPPEEVFLNLFETMRSSVAADFQHQYNAHQIHIAAQHNETKSRLAETEKQNEQLRERLLSVEKLRSEERSRWEVERKNLMRQLEQGENDAERRERRKMQEEEARREKEEHDKVNRKLVEKYEAKKKAWAKEKDEMSKRVDELEQENRRLEEVIASDDQLLVSQLQEMEEEKKEQEESMEEERSTWEAHKNALIQELLQTKKELESERKKHHETVSKMYMLEMDIENLKSEEEELSTQLQQQKEIWDTEKSILVTRLKNERDVSTQLKNKIQEREAKRKRGDDSETTFTAGNKKAKVDVYEDDDESPGDEEMEGAVGEWEGTGEECGGAEIEREGAEGEWEGANWEREGVNWEWERAKWDFNNTEDAPIRAAEELRGVGWEQRYEEQEQERAGDDSDGADAENAGIAESSNQQFDDDSDDLDGFYV